MFLYHFLYFVHRVSFYVYIIELHFVSKNILCDMDFNYVYT